MCQISIETSQKRGERLGLKENSENFKTQKGVGNKAASWKALSRQYPSPFFQIQLDAFFNEAVHRNRMSRLENDHYH
jgi:hypothetical protein